MTDEPRWMVTVVIESPFAGDTARNKHYLARCVADCFKRGEAPFASHGLYPQWLDDDNPEHRSLGIRAGFAVGVRMDVVAFYVDYGMSPGMEEALKYYRSLPSGFVMPAIEIREIGKNDQ